jgi:hypothetical protein
MADMQFWLAVSFGPDRTIPIPRLFHDTIDNPLTNHVLKMWPLSQGTNMAECGRDSTRRVTQNREA